MQEESRLAYPTRKWYRKVPWVADRSAKSLLDDEGNRRLTPEASANWWDYLTFGWLSELIAIGYSRPLDKEELYLLPETHDASLYGGRLDDHIVKLQSKILDGGWQKQKKRLRFNFHSPAWRLARSLNATVMVWFWTGGIIKLFADTATITSPLLVRKIITFLRTSELRRNAGEPQPPIGEGIGLAIGLAALLAFGVMANVHGFYRGYSSGILLRSALIESLFRRTVNFSPLERTTYNLDTSRFVSMISTDVSRIDFGAGYFHSVWTSVIQILICLGLTVSSLGPSALAGFGLMAVLVPTQNAIVKHLFVLRRRSMPFTDARLAAITEALDSIRLVKVFAWEEALLCKISGLRRDELRLLRNRLMWRALNVALSFSVPTLAAVVSFVTYAAIGNTLDAAEIFSALTLFMLLRTPLQLLPVAFGATADAANAIDRLSSAFDAPKPKDPLPMDENLEPALELYFATFSYRIDDELEAASSREEKADEKAQLKDERRFMLCDLNLRLKRGELLMVVGPVGAGKSTLLGSLVGETRLENGRAVLGSRYAYAPQQAWLMSASIRDNILFGRSWDAARYEKVLNACALASDLSEFPEGDRTVVGEKGISLSGGQRQRVALARTIYEPCPLLFLDDVFSALDAHVQAQVFKNVVLDRQLGTSLVLVTHSLHLLHHADRICALSDGRIAELGSFHELVEERQGETRRLVEEFASKSMADAQREKERKDKEEADRISKGDTPLARTATDTPATSESLEPTQSKSATNVNEPIAAKKETAGKAIMQNEERFVGSVTKHTYAQYIRKGKPNLTLTLFVFSILIFQGGSILSPLWLQWWQEHRYANIAPGSYMAIYAALGICQALGLLAMSCAFGFFIFYSASQMHADAIRSVLRAPISFFDTTPLGRITHRFSKDTDSIDNVIGEAFRMLLSTTAQVVGAVILISIILPWFLLAVFFIVICYILTGMYYRPAARELRRCDALLRSPIYENASESLRGIMVIRSLGAVQTTLERNIRYLNRENSPYWLSVACQRWLSVRLDLLGTFLVLIVGIIVVASRNSISAAQGGVALSYIVTVQSVFGFMIRQSAEIENNMNAIERLLYYSNDIPQERPHRRPDDLRLMQDQWAGKGSIELQDLVFAHRTGLPPSLRGVNLSIPPGTRVALVGRTGSGKSTILSALVGIGEITSGKVLIDGIDTSTIGLNLLRRRIAFMPQEATVLSGTLRYNLDPFNEHDDADLWRVMHQVGLSSLTSPQSSDSSLTNEKAEGEKTAYTTQNLTLDTDVHAERGNLSSGQKSLISLARALIKDASIFILDEATASMDLELDQHVQRVLRARLKGKTMIVVAHRLDSIIGSSDLVCVVDEGRIVQVGSPLELYEHEQGLFRVLCTNAGIGEGEILAAKRRFDRE